MTNRTKGNNNKPPPGSMTCEINDDIMYIICKCILLSWIGSSSYSTTGRVMYWYRMIYDLSTEIDCLHGVVKKCGKK